MTLFVATDPCPACARAKTLPRTGILQAGCHGCWIRTLATSPHHIRSAAYDREPIETRAKLIAEVAAEYHRIRQLEAAA